MGRIEIGLLNRVILNDVHISDQQGRDMIGVSRLSVKWSLTDLALRRVTIVSSQLFGLNADIRKSDADSPANIQFLIDSLTSDSGDEGGGIDLCVRSLIVRHGSANYRREDIPTAADRFSVADIRLRNISGHVIVGALTPDSLNVRVKRLAFDDGSGLQMHSLSFKMAVNRNALRIEDFGVELPSSRLAIEDISATYAFAGDSLDPSSIAFSARVAPSSITPSDLRCFVPELAAFHVPVVFNCDIAGTNRLLEVKAFESREETGSFAISARGGAETDGDKISWHGSIDRLATNGEYIARVVSAFNVAADAAFLSRLGDISLTAVGQASGDRILASATLTTAVGEADIECGSTAGVAHLAVTTDGIDIGTLLDDARYGSVAASVEGEGVSKDDFKANASIQSFEYNSYIYNDISADIEIRNGTLQGRLSSDDANCNALVSGVVDISGECIAIDAECVVHRLVPSALHLTDRWDDAVFALDADVDIAGATPDDIVGMAAITDLSVIEGEKEYYLQRLLVTAEHDDTCRTLRMNSDFGRAEIAGAFRLSTVLSSVRDIVGNKLPFTATQSDGGSAANNELIVSAEVTDARWAELLLGIPLQLVEPLRLQGTLSDANKTAVLTCEASEIVYGEKTYRDVALSVNADTSVLDAVAKITAIDDKGSPFVWRLDATADGGRLHTALHFNEGEQHPLHGRVVADTRLLPDMGAGATTIIDVESSTVYVGDTIWQVQPAHVAYSKNHLTVSDFFVAHDDQYIAIDGQATTAAGDTLYVRFKDVNVRYVLDLVNFHSVQFDGLASGTATVAAAFGREPQAVADVTVDRFLFETGRMGVLRAAVVYDNDEKQINLDAVAHDGNRSTVIRGYVSPARNDIHLDIDAHDTRAEFVQSFCGSFMRDINVSANGRVTLWGALNRLNLTGDLVCDGTIGMSSLNTTYTLPGDTIRFVVDEIQFVSDTVIDRHGHKGIVTGGVQHNNLKRIRYDISIDADNVLAFDTDDRRGDLFYGTVYATGNCHIVGKSGETVLDINARPEPGTVIVYDVSSEEALASNDFIRWNDAETAEATDETATHATSSDADEPSLVSDLRMNFLVDATPDATLKVIMDNSTGDYIALNGDGALRATYYNKGAFEMFGNYVVSSGIYKMTIQNLIKKDFVFEDGGTVKFGGDPFAAALDLQAQYILNSVSLSDLSIGRSFSSNNIRVNCLMNISGTAGEPKVAFSLDLPTLDSDAKRMVYSVINAEEEMNQQVLYLLAVGRFYTQGTNNSDTETSSSQTSLAMQSILSGTISQQLNAVIGNMVNMSNWNFGANISTGTEGLNDAEYEGILSGRLLNNRLLVNGQFGYRDNANATTTFIGDFDLKYLLYPNGNLAINVYNKTNDRYFTRSTLNTQGIGIVMKTDFTRLSELFKKKKSTDNEEVKGEK